MIRIGHAHEHVSSDQIWYHPIDDDVFLGEEIFFARPGPDF